MSFDPDKITFFAKTDARGAETPFGIKAIDRARHMYVIGKTGMGKSTLLENMAVQDMKNGEGIAFIDPHGATAETLLDYVPEERKGDVLYFAPFDAENPIAFNVMEDVGADKRHLVVSGLMSVFKKIWVDAWSARMEYILQNTLLALLEYPDSTLLGVNRMLSEKHYRQKVIDNITDPAVKSFWVDEFLNYNERYMQEAGDAIKNKIGQFTANPLIRNIIGQPKSSFDLRKMMDERKIIIMNLSKGLVGESNANLLGSMLTTRIYLAAMSRADLTQQQMQETPNFYFYVDEFQSFANATFADILSEARKYKLNLTIAHQYIEQMEEEVRNAVFGNVGTIIAFRVGPFDAEVLETIFAPQFYAVDVCNLGFAQVYLTLMIDGIGSQPFSAITLPPIPKATTSCKDIVINMSRKQFGKPRGEVEEYITGWHEEKFIPSRNSPAGNQQNRNGSRQQGGGQQRNSSTSAPKKPVARNSANSNQLASALAAVMPERAPQIKTTEKPAPAKSESASPVAEQKPAPKKTDDHRSTGNAKLDDLRAVLASISKKDTDKNSQSKAAHTKPSTAEKQHNDLKTKKEDAATDQAAHLKEALAASSRKPVVENPRRSKESEVKEQNQERERGPEKKNEIKKDDARTHNHRDQKMEEKLTPHRVVKSDSVHRNQQPQSSPAKPVEQQAQEGPYGISYAEAKSYGTSSRVPKKDPLDPKKLERMMRPKSNDRTPLK